MKVTTIDNIHQITFFPSLFPVNCYLVEEENGLTLIDAALPKKADAILSVAEEIGKPITHILLTHGHSDHIGSLDELVLKISDVKLAISTRDARLLAGDKSLDPEEGTSPIKGGIPKHIQTKPDILLEEGHTIGSLKAIATPGHTPGSMSFLDQRTHSIIAGDAFQTRASIAVAGTIVPLFPFPGFATWNKEKALDSAKKIAALSPTLLAVGHGKLIQNPGPQIQHAIDHMETKG
ncbi:MBL fold metallo-hydrolase [Radiobacillus deserti]|uniref:MBL fold metallo-hydrolase n=1 Tax=Radiobacillus deserti TaxID=2594883 RepID=A0A516KF13_9BACI|nr:MBL fold metallo-hydrolase [Radiobacillus deserti]QDP39970.1 MBL fold metallo-hydrolase [Radiobacillus deserti]